MTTMTIDFKANAPKPYAYYIVDRNYYKTTKDVLDIAEELLHSFNNTVYLIRVYIDGEEIALLRNDQ